MAEKSKGRAAQNQNTDSKLDNQPPWLEERLKWFTSLQFGVLFHWGPCSQWDGYGSWPLVPADKWARRDDMKCWCERGKDIDRFTRDYWDLNKTFNPVQFDPDAWAQSAEEAGMRYASITTKHHDGFCLFDTDTTDYKVTHPSCPFHRHPRANITREVFDAFRKRGMAISCYFSKSDWHCPYYWSPDAPIVDRNPNYDTHKNPERWANFVSFVHRQIEELMTQYGKIDILWLDGGQVRPPDQDIKMDELAAMARSHQPGLIIADRTVGGPYENFLTPEQHIPDKKIDGPWESCITLGTRWNFLPDDKFKPASEVVRMLDGIVADGGNLLLGIGPDSQGLIPAEAVERLREIGKLRS